MTTGVDELHQQMRGMLTRASVAAVDDTGSVQTADITTHDSVDRAAVPIWQPYGLASLPPDPEAFVMAAGGDQGAQLAILLSAAYRFGKMAAGEVALFDHGANRVHLKAGGNIDLHLKQLLDVLCETMTITAKGGVTVTGPVTFNDAVTFLEDVSFAKDVMIAGNLTVGGVVSGTGKTRGAL